MILILMISFMIIWPLISDPHCYYHDKLYTHSPLQVGDKTRQPESYAAVSLENDDDDVEYDFYYVDDHSNDYEGVYDDDVGYIDDI